jgi:stage V sporulation protein R
MSMSSAKPLPQTLADIQRRMEQYARDYGLDFFPTIFELVDVDQLNAVAAYGGFPTRYPHWRFGMEYQRLSKGYAYGLQKIYELVINNDPCYAYLLGSNSMTDHMMVIAHVYGHCDFFKNNYWFSQTNRKMVDEVANHGNRIRRYMDRFGVETVETFIDACLSVEDLIDLHSPFIQRYDLTDKYEFPQNIDQEDPTPPPARFQAKEYMEPYINPPSVLARQKDEHRRRKEQADEKFPKEPMRDVMLFLLQHAPLKPWQLDVLSIIRDEAYYFAPQAQTKIMNEGWATYWHSTIMTRHGLAEGGDVINYADHMSGTLASSPTRLNPYKLGVELLRDIEDRWNRGCFGRQYDECDDLVAKERWDTHAGQGREKLFQVRRIHNDVTFIDEFLTFDFCRRQKLFSFGYNEHTGYYEIESREFDEVKERLLFNLTNLGRPIIQIRDGNYKNRGELFLEHLHNGPELKLSDAQGTLESLFQLWRRPVHIETVLEGHVTTLSYDGNHHENTNSNKKVAATKEES